MEEKGDNTPKELELKELISRDLEQHESGAVFRGPIKRVSIREEEDNEGHPYRLAEFYLDWVAQKTLTGWVKWKSSEDLDDPDMGVLIARINLDVGAMYKDEKGIFHGSIPYVGSFRVLKKGDSLKREDVVGLGKTGSDSKNEHT